MSDVSVLLRTYRAKPGCLELNVALWDDKRVPWNVHGVPGSGERDRKTWCVHGDLFKSHAPGALLSRKDGSSGKMEKCTAWDGDAEMPLQAANFAHQIMSGRRCVSNRGLKCWRMRECGVSFA